MKIFYLLIRKVFFSDNIAMLNSPLQFINFFEYEKNLKFKFNFIIIGYTSIESLIVLKKTIKYFKCSHENIFFINEIIGVKFFHFLLNIKKIFLKNFELCLVGDFRYYLHKKVYKMSKSCIIVDDGTNSILLKNKDFKREKTIFYSLFNLKFNAKKILPNNLDFLSKQIENKKIKNTSLVLLPGFYNKFEQPKDIYIKEVLKIIKKIKGKIQIIPHRVEYDFVRKNFYFLKNSRINFQFPYLPIEIFLLKNKLIPKKIYSIYSTSTITLHKMLKDKKIQLINCDYKYPKNMEKIYLPIKNYFKKIGIKFLKY